MSSSAAEQPIKSWQRQKHLVVDRHAWSWNWSSWDQEKMITWGDFQYVPYWDSDRVLVLVRRNLQDDTIQTLRLPAMKLSSNDRHRNTCLGASHADGRLHLSWDHHNSPLNYAKSRKGFLTEPAGQLSADDFEPPAPMLSDRKQEARVTYPRFLNDRRGDLFFTYRIGGSGNGDNYWHRYNPTDGSWKRIGMLFSSKGTYVPWRNSTSRCAYLHDLRFDSRNRLHVSWVYRETSASWASNHDLHYAYSDDQGLTWCNNAGRKIADLAKGDPIGLSDPGIVVREIPVYSWLMNAGCMALDSADRPHAVTYKSRFAHRPQKLEHGPPAHIQQQLCFVHFWRSESGTWLGGAPIDPGPLGVSRGDVVFDGENNLCFVYVTSEGFRCLKARADDRWRSWSTPERLTGPDLSGRDASKYDRRRWADDGIFSFTARERANGFGIVEFSLR